MTQFNFEAIGTSWQIDIFDLASNSENKILEKIKFRIDEFDKIYSRFRKDSLVTEMSQKVGDYVLPKDSKKLFEIYFDLYKKTGGLFTPLVGNILSDAGYDAEYSLEQKKELMSPRDWQDVMEFDFPKLKIKIPTILDFGAGGKGYLVDIVGDLLEQNGITKYCIDAGGDILHKNNEELKVGLENPFNLDEVVGICNLKNKSICGSAGTRRKWGEFNHIMNPHTLKSTTEVVAVWVVADTTLVADCIATCLFFVKPETLRASFKFDYVLIREDKTISKSENFDGEIFS